MFKKKKYAIVKNVISKDMANFIYNYFLMKKQVYDTCLKEKFISPFESMLGLYEPNDGMIPNTYSHYSDIVMETLLLKCQPVMEKVTQLKLQPSYTYARIYKKGDVLKRHKDRFSCEISCTMNLGGNNWSIYLEPSGNLGKKGIKVDLKAGDILVYRGCELEHWRKKFHGNSCCQVFLHYNDIKTTNSKKNIYDGRLHLGLPHNFKKLYN